MFAAALDRQRPPCSVEVLHHCSLQSAGGLPVFLQPLFGHGDCRFGRGREKPQGERLCDLKGLCVPPAFSPGEVFGRKVAEWSLCRDERAVRFLQSGGEAASGCREYGVGQAAVFRQSSESGCFCRRGGNRSFGTCGTALTGGGVISLERALDVVFASAVVTGQGCQHVPAQFVVELLTFRQRLFSAEQLGEKPQLIV